MELKALEWKVGSIAASICVLAICICVAFDSEVAWAIAGVFVSVLVFIVPACFLMRPRGTRAAVVNETARASRTRPIATVLSIFWIPLTLLLVIPLSVLILELIGSVMNGGGGLFGEVAAFAAILFCSPITGLLLLAVAHFRQEKNYWVKMSYHIGITIVAVLANGGWLVYMCVGFR